MGFFFGRKKKIEDAKKKNTPVDVKLDEPVVVSDMIELIKTEQEEMLNPFSAGRNDNSGVSYAKRHGSKYASIKGGQLASSKVVDVRSYVKPSEEKSGSFKNDKKSSFEEELDKLQKEEREDKKETKSANSSFFDDLLKSIEDDLNEPDDNLTEEIEEEKVPELKKKPSIVRKPLVEDKQKENKPKKKRKKSIDIDIISGDFGGSDII